MYRCVDGGIPTSYGLYGSNGGVIPLRSKVYAGAGTITLLFEVALM